MYVIYVISQVPFDTRRLVFPPAGAAFFAYIFYTVLVTFMSYGVGMALLSGGALGYVIYDMMHYYLHHGVPERGSYLHSLKYHHILHHFDDHSTGKWYLIMFISLLFSLLQHYCVVVVRSYYWNKTASFNRKNVFKVPIRVLGCLYKNWSTHFLYSPVNVATSKKWCIGKPICFSTTQGLFKFRSSMQTPNRVISANHHVVNIFDNMVTNIWKTQ